MQLTLRKCEVNFDMQITIMVFPWGIATAFLLSSLPLFKEGVNRTTIIVEYLQALSTT